MTTIATRFRIRRDTAANWTSVNPVLLLGEPGLETDTDFVKYGDGVSAWNDLPYAGANAEWGDITGTLADQTDLQAALDAKAPLASPTFSGTLTAPTVALAGASSAFQVTTRSTGANWTIFNNAGALTFHNGTTRLAMSSAAAVFSGEVRCASLRIDTAPTSAAVAQTHHVPISLNGVTYKLLLAT